MSGASIGFLSDVRRMNVALTRARLSLWVVGHAGTLAACEPWRLFMEHCERQRALAVARKPYKELLRWRRGG